MKLYNTIESARTAANSLDRAGFFDWYGGMVLDTADYAASSMEYARRDLDILCRQDIKTGNFNTMKLAFWYGALTGGLEFGVKTAVNVPVVAEAIIVGKVSLSDMAKGVEISLRRKWDVFISIPDRLAAGEIASLSHDMTMEGAEIYLYATGAGSIVSAVSNVVTKTIGGVRAVAEGAADALTSGRLVPVVGVLDCGSGGANTVAAVTAASSAGNATVPAILMAAGGSAGSRRFYTEAEIANIQTQADKCKKLLDDTYTGRWGDKMRSTLRDLPSSAKQARGKWFILLARNSLDVLRREAIANGADNLASAIDELGQILSRRHGTPHAIKIATERYLK